jgi:hypothetical protein
VALTKPRDRAVIGPAVRGDQPKRDVLDTLALDHPRGPLPTRIGIHQQRDHHRRIVRRTPVTIHPVIGVERGEIHLLNHRDHKPREVILRQPLIQTRRHQERLIAITPQEALRHTDILLTPPDGTQALYATASMRRSTDWQATAASAESQNAARRP